MFKVIILLPFGLFIFSYILYYLSLEKCFDGFDICCNKKRFIQMKLFQLILSSFIISFLIESMFYNYTSKFNLIHLVIVFTCFYKYSHGKDFDDHGFFNFFGIFAFIFLIIILLLPFNILIYCINKKNKNYLLIYISILIIFFLFYFFYIKNFMTCDDWPLGLNNTYIENDINKYGCQIRFPKSCPYKIGNKIFDLSKWKGVNCNIRKKGGLNKILSFSKSPYLNINSKRIGFPLTNIEPICCEKSLGLKDYSRFINYVKYNLIDIDNKKMNNKLKKNIPEIVVDFSRNPLGEMIIKLNYNDNLRKARKKLEINSVPYSNNILILFLDSVSRVNSINQLKKTLKFIEQFMPYKGNFNYKYSSENFHSFQFLKYHSFKGYTAKNYLKIFYGENSGKHVVRITKYLKENGFITGLASDFCYRDNTRTFHKMKKEEVYDHQMVICDPNESHWNNMLKRCLYGKLNSEHLFEYGNQFWRNYKHNRKFLTIISNDGHEGSLLEIKYTDDLIFKFLNNLYNENLLKDSSILLISDHGESLPSLYYLYDFYQIEYFLPMFYIIINDRKDISYKEQFENIYKNQQTLITAYDIYNTIGHIIYGDKYKLIKNKTRLKDSPKSPLGISLFSEINPKSRTPLLYNISNFICK